MGLAPVGHAKARNNKAIHMIQRWQVGVLTISLLNEPKWNVRSNIKLIYGKQLTGRWWTVDLIRQDGRVDVGWNPPRGLYTRRSGCQTSHFQPRNNSSVGNVPLAAILHLFKKRIWAGRWLRFRFRTGPIQLMLHISSFSFCPAFNND